MKTRLFYKDRMEVISKIRNIFSASRTDAQKQTTALFNLHKAKFIAYVRKEFPEIDEGTILEIYIDSFMIMYDNVRDGKLIVLKCELETYLIGIGKNLALRYLRKKRSLPETVFEDDLPELADVDEEEIKNQKLEIAFRLVSEMDKLCKEILFLFYWERKKMFEIAKIMNYKDEDSAKNRKSKCMKKIKTALKREFIKEGLI